MGEVWHATDLTLNRSVAVKLLQGDRATPADTERFRLEAQTAARLNHPNVVAVYDFGSHQGRHYLVMECVDGRSLAEERRPEGVPDARDAADIAAQTAAGLEAAHRHRVVHRDIKPGNVMITADRTVKIADFGIARFADEGTGTLTATGHIMGSAAYLPPERALGRPAQPASDIYSLGCVLFELLTGRPPFTGATALAIIQQHVDTAPVSPSRLRPGIPGPLADYVLLMLAKDPARRPTAEEAAAWLAAAPTPAHGPAGVAPLADQPPPLAAPTPPLAAPAPPLARPAASSPFPPPARPPAARSRPRRRPVRQRTVLMVAGLAAFAVAVAVGALLTSSNGRHSGTPAGHPSTGVATVTSVPTETSATSPTTGLSETAPGGPSLAPPAMPPVVGGPAGGPRRKDDGGPGPKGKNAPGPKAKG